MTTKLMSPYIPRAWAIPFHETAKRWMLLVVHRRAGKTTAAVNYLIGSATRFENTRYAYIAPTYRMAKGVAWDILKKHSQFIPGVEYRESELTVVYPNGSKIALYGAENPDRLRGLGFSGVVFDEYGQQPDKIFTEVIRPTLIDNGGYAIWIGTPQGKDEFYRLYEQHKNDDEWFVRHLTVDDTGVIPQEEIENAKKTMSQEEWLQELYCSFESSAKGAVYAEELRLARAENRIGVLPYHREVPVHTVWDIGVGPALAMGFYQCVSGKMHMMDFWQGTDSEGIEQAVNVVLRKPYTYGKHFAPHDMNTRESTTGKTRLEYAKGLGLSFSVLSPKNVHEGIQAGKFLFGRLLVDEEKCAQWLEAIAEYRRQWDDRRKMFKEVPYHNWTSHAADVHRYAAIAESRMTDRNDYISTYDPLGIGELPSAIGDPYY